jgi:23S rRNA pseudouridine2605 synthase
MPRKTTKKRAAKKSAGPPPDQTQRLQRLLASAGFGSRRQCEELIEEGRVAIDGKVVTKLGTTVDPDASKVHVDGTLLHKQKLVYYAVNKPVGVVTTNRDPHGRPRVVDLVPHSERVFPVGRLDRSSEGLILLTNDGDLAQRLTHPKFGVRKVYRVTVAGKVGGETMKQMRKGIYIAEGFVKVEGAKLLKSRSRSTEMEIVLREGKNREIRRILARLGHKVQQLRRIAVGPLRLGDIPPGAYRVVRREEVKKLWTATEQAVESAAPKRGGKKHKSGGKPITAGKPKSGGKPITGGKPKSGGKPNATRRPTKKSGSAKLEYGGSRKTGAVIGGDTPVADDSRTPKRSAKKRSTKKKVDRKPTSSQRGGSKTTKRSPGRKRKR